MKPESDIREKIGQHRNALQLWVDGVLTPTEPDEVEREAVQRELMAAIKTLEWVLEEKIDA